MKTKEIQQIIANYYILSRGSGQGFDSCTNDVADEMHINFILLTVC